MKCAEAISLKTAFILFVTLWTFLINFSETFGTFLVAKISQLWMEKLHNCVQGEI